MSDKNFETNAEDAMILARTSLLFNSPFFGNLAMRLEMVEVKEDAKTSMFRTAAVDGRNLYFNTEFVLALSEEERVFLVTHEIMHCVLGHLYRRFDRDPKIFNMACDYVINAALIEEGLIMPKVGLYEKKYLDMSAEDVYDDLIENNVSPQETLDHHAGDPGYPGQGEGGKGDGDGEGGGEGEEKDGTQGDLSEDDDGTMGGRGKDEPTKEEKDAMEDYWKDGVAQAAAAVGAGSVPAGLRRFIEDFLDPKMDWREYIQMTIQDCVRNDYTWMIPNKRFFGSGITMPRMDVDDAIEIAVAIDTSGSVGEDMLKDFLSEIKGICDQFSGYTIHLACFDGAVHNPQTFTEEEDLMEYELEGFGGTDFMAWWNFADKQPWKDDISKILFFTDGYPYGDWGNEDMCPCAKDGTIWIVHGSTNKGPFGETIFYEDHKR